jgi:hypothetical protein
LAAPTHWHWHLQKSVGGVPTMEFWLSVVGNREDRSDTILAAPTDRCSWEPAGGDPMREDRLTILAAPTTHWHWHLQKPVGGVPTMEFWLIVVGKREDRSDTILAAPIDWCSW